MKRTMFLLLIFLLSCCGQKEVYTFTCHYQDEKEEWQNTYTVQDDEILQLTYRRTSRYAFSERELQKRMDTAGIRFQILSLSEGSLTLVLSCSSMDTSVYPEALLLLKEIIR